MNLREIMLLDHWSIKTRNARRLLASGWASGFVTVNGNKIRRFDYECVSGDVIVFGSETYVVPK